MLPAMTVSMSDAPLGRAGTIQLMSFRNSAKPARSRATITKASTPATMENNAG